ncbi:hypothetical protein GOODEAATRI_013294 [Goodea atripinnis]|uniref:Uncharacterized protein n=1 Tax=Goodea atripinnis TaxID=208336 RepID=A0ABV0P3Z1_9TELE
MELVLLCSHTSLPHSELVPAEVRLRLSGCSDSHRPGCCFYPNSVYGFTALIKQQTAVFLKGGGARRLQAGSGVKLLIEAFKAGADSKPSSRRRKQRNDVEAELQPRSGAAFTAARSCRKTQRHELETCLDLAAACKNSRKVKPTYMEQKPCFPPG